MRIGIIDALKKREEAEAAEKTSQALLHSVLITRLRLFILKIFKVAIY